MNRRGAGAFLGSHHPSSHARPRPPRPHHPARGRLHLLEPGLPGVRTRRRPRWAGSVPALPSRQHPDTPGAGSPGTPPSRRSLRGLPEPQREPRERTGAGTELAHRLIRRTRLSGRVDTEAEEIGSERTQEALRCPARCVGGTEASHHTLASHHDARTVSPDPLGWPHGRLLVDQPIRPGVPRLGPRRHPECPAGQRRPTVRLPQRQHDRGPAQHRPQPPSPWRRTRGLLPTRPA